MNTLQDKYKEKTPLIASLILISLMIIFLVPYNINVILNIIIRLSAGILALVVARDTIVIYGKKKEEKTKN